MKQKTLITNTDLGLVPNNRKRIIDADRNVVIETFNAKDTDKKVKEYRDKGQWNDVGVDCDGDIILWED